MVEGVLTGLLGLECSLEAVAPTLQAQEVQLVLLGGLAANIEGIGTSDEESGVCFALDFPGGVESLRDPGPVLDWDDDRLGPLCCDSLSELALGVWLICLAYQSVEESCAVWQWEEEATLMSSQLFNFDFLTSFLFLHLLELGHRLWGVGHLVLGGTTSRHDQSRLSGEVALAVLACSADGRVDGPLLVLSVLDGDALVRRLPHLRRES